MTTTTTTMSDPWEMALIHRLIGTGLAQAREFVLADDAASRTDAIAAYVGFHLDGLYVHHSTEDELLWPALRERADLSAALITRMEAQHEGVHEATEVTREKLAAWTAAATPAAATELAEALDTLVGRLSAHLSEEERDVVPLIAAHITQAEWDRLGKAAFSKFTPQQRFTATGELISTATPDEARRMLAGIPAPIRVIWRLFGQRKYDRFMADVRG
jgi:hemerythrin-like domain-containing protein